jgi:hypothetical protein
LIRIVAAAFAAFVISACLVAAEIPPKALAGPSMVASSARSLRGYYLAKFTDQVGYPIPFSSLCLRFTSSGAWYSVPPNTFNGTYLLSGGELFASALAPWSPTAYASLQGSVNAKQGSGDYIITQPTGAIYSGGTFTMTRDSGCK